MKHHDVAIIGGGVHGASAAFHLTRRGVRPAVFERTTPAGGPTGLSSAICRSYYTNEFLAVMARDSIQMMQNFKELTGGESGFRRTGFLYLHPPEDRDGVIATAARLNEMNIETDVLDRDRLSSEFPTIDLAGVGLAAWDATAGHADPAGTTMGLLSAAVRSGAVPYMRTSILDLQLLPSGGARLVTDRDGSHTCDRLLIAAGPWTAKLTELIGVSLPLTTERHIVAHANWGGAQPMPFGHADLLSGYYCKPEGTESFILGWLHPTPEVSPDIEPAPVSDDEAAGLFLATGARVPDLMSAEARGAWAGFYDVSPDWQPVIGEVAPGVFVDAGTSGHGFKLAPALGERIAALIEGDVDPRLGQFHPSRFTQGQELNAGFGDARIIG